MRKGTVSKTGYQKTVFIQAPPADVYRALTTLKGLKGWWTPLVKGSAGLGGRIRFEFQGLEEHILMKVMRADKPRSVHWICLEHTSLGEWDNTHLTFEIGSRSEKESRLSFQHVGLTPKLECFNECRMGWDYFLESLKSYIEKGDGAPYRG